LSQAKPRLRTWQQHKDQAIDTTTMTQFVAKCLVLFVVAFSTFAETGKPNHSRAPKGFHYSESQETIQVDVPFESSSLAGVAVADTGAGLDKVLVECLDPGWGRRRSARFTNPEGAFRFGKQGTGTHYLRLSKPGFKTLLVKVLIVKKAPSQLRLELRVTQ
jgi:hypothetical protein